MQLAAMMTLTERGVLDAAARHFGLVTLEGSRWDLLLDDPDNVYDGLPVVWMPDGTPDCPLTAVTAAIDRRAGHFLRELVEAYRELCAGLPKTKKRASRTAPSAKSTRAGTKPTARKRRR